MRCIHSKVKYSPVPAVLSVIANVMDGLAVVFVQMGEHMVERMNRLNGFAVYPKDVTIFSQRKLNTTPGGNSDWSRSFGSLFLSPWPESTS